LENKLESFVKNFQGLEHNIGEKFDFLLEFLQKDKNQNTGGQNGGDKHPNKTTGTTGPTEFDH
jgi:hypothetical protein